MQSTSQAIQEMKSSTHLNTQDISKLENQVGQLATQVGEREKGNFPSQPIPNPKGQYAINGSSSSTLHMNLFSLLLPLRLVSKLIIK